jgi:hypothetical protein
MFRRADLRIRHRDLALPIDQIAYPAGVRGGRIGAGAVRNPNFALSIGQQPEREIEFFCECGIGIDRVEADTKNLDAALFEIAILVAEPATFASSARGVRFWVKPQQNFVTTQ